jgi:putative ATP-binding cassette transporter
MILFELLSKESAGSRRLIIGAIAISGIANAIMVAVINAAAKTAAYDEMNFRYMVMFVAAIGLYIVGLKYSFDAITKLFEGMIHKVRVRLIEKISHSELLLLDHIGKAELFKRINQDTTVISESQSLLVASVHSAVMVLCISVYVLTISVAAFIITVLLVFGGVTIFLSKKQEVERCMEQTAAIEIDLIGLANHAIEGLKELKLSQERTRELLVDVVDISKSLENVKVRTMNMYNDMGLFSQSFFYILVACIVFFLPWMEETYSGSVTELVAVILFIIGPLSTIVKAIPTFSKANTAMESIVSLEDAIENFGAQFGELNAVDKEMNFTKKIEIRGLEFHYGNPNGQDFKVGPIDLEIDKGNIVMIAGGNGSGKTTFLKAMTTLYFPTAGSVHVDGVDIVDKNVQRYRGLFSAIFTDFHLFGKLYGLGVVPADTVLTLLELLRLRDKTGYLDGRFTSLDLSTGQRKRLALIVALLEDRPIMIFDEWAADQDPDFRRYFYETLLPELRTKGKTVIISTHDDRYFELSDVLIKMENGLVVDYVKH